MLDWAELPDIHDVRDALKHQADLKARIRIEELQLDILRAVEVQKKPRDTSVKFVGTDEESGARIQKVLHNLIALKNELDAVEADIKFHEYRRDAAKTMSYKGRA
jgi:hypothetical protein